MKHLILLYLILSFQSVYSQHAWFRLEPPTSKVLNTAYFNSADTGWIAGSDGVICKTENGGQSWAHQQPAETENFNVIYEHPFSPGIFWLGGNNGVLYKSDSTSLWIKFLLNESRNIYDLHFISQDKGFISGSGALLKKTTNRGTSWFNVQSGLSTIDLYSVESVSEQILLSCGGNGYILRSTNEGNNWGLINSGTTEKLYSIFRNPANSDLWIAGGGGTILYSSNAGLNWSRKITGTNKDLRDIYFASETQGWAAGDSGTVLKTTDRGNTWQRSSPSTAVNLRSIRFRNESFGFVCGDAGKIFLTTDSGTTWAAEYSGTDLDLSSLYVPNDISSIYAAGGSGRLIRRSGPDPNYNSWGRIYLYFLRVYSMIRFYNSSLGLAVGYNGLNSGYRGIIAKTTDGGEKWVTMVSPTTEYINSIEILNENNYWITCTNNFYVSINKIYNTTNGGASWNAKSLNLGDGNYLRKIKFTSPQTAFCQTSGKFILYSSDAGNNWTVRNTPYIFTAIEFINDTIIRAVADVQLYLETTPMFFYSTNAGQTWSSWRRAKQNPSINVLKVINGTKQVVAGDLGIVEMNVYNTTLSYQHWLPPYIKFNDIAFGDSLTGYVVGGEGVIYKTYSGGLPVELKSFEAVLSGKEVRLNWCTASEINNSGFEVQRKISDPQKKINSTWSTIGFVRGAGTSTVEHLYTFGDSPQGGYGYRYRLSQSDYNGTSSLSNEAEVYVPEPEMVGIEPNYPNPFSESTTINYYLPYDGDYTVSVINVNGEEVERLAFGAMESGKHTLEWNAKDKSSGVYYFLVRGPGYKSGIKLMVIK